MTQAAMDNDTMVAVTPEIAACPFGHPFVAKYPRSAVQRVVWARGFADRYKVMCECGAEGPYGDTQKEALDAWNALHQSGRTGAGGVNAIVADMKATREIWIGEGGCFSDALTYVEEWVSRLAALSQSTAGEDGT